MSETLWEVQAQRQRLRENTDRWGKSPKSTVKEKIRQRKNGGKKTGVKRKKGR